MVTSDGAAPAALSGAKYPYTSLQKSLRLLIDGNESLDGPYDRSPWAG